MATISEVKLELKQTREKLTLAEKTHQENKDAVAKSRVKVWRYKHAIKALEQIQ